MATDQTIDSRVPEKDRAALKAIGSALTQPAELLPPMPAKPTLVDFFNYRLRGAVKKLPFEPRKHMIQAASLAMRAGAEELVILGCLLHDIGMAVSRPDHGWWGAQLIEPYVPEEVSWAVRYHQALRYYPDASVGYEYPEIYVQVFGADYHPPDYIEAAYQYARNHRWYMQARMITVFDDYSFDKNAEPELEPFMEIIGRHFTQPAEGLGFDNSPSAHMWRTLIDPNKPL